jgi:hypothetical protein
LRPEDALLGVRLSHWVLHRGQEVVHGEDDERRDDKHRAALSQEPGPALFSVVINLDEGQADAEK